MRITFIGVRASIWSMTKVTLALSRYGGGVADGEGDFGDKPRLDPFVDENAENSKRLERWE